MKQVEVQIMGATYVLGCKEEAEADLLKAVRLVDEHMCKIRDKGKTKARERVAVLAALNITAELHEQHSQLSKQVLELQKQLENQPASAPNTMVAPVDLFTTEPQSATSTVATGDSRLDDLLLRIDQALDGNGEGRLF